MHKFHDQMPVTLTANIFDLWLPDEVDAEPFERADQTLLGGHLEERSLGRS